tara:strand:- start:277 stop:474 length:198 start_codon:yes stop_codon:yes gene_type:complete
MGNFSMKAYWAISLVLLIIYFYVSTHPTLLIMVIAVNIFIVASLSGKLNKLGDELDQAKKDKRLE